MDPLLIGAHYEEPSSTEHVQGHHNDERHQKDFDHNLLLVWQILLPQGWVDPTHPCQLKQTQGLQDTHEGSILEERLEE